MSATIRRILTLGIFAVVVLLPVASLPPIDVESAQQSTGSVWCVQGRGGGAVFVGGTRYATSFSPIFGFGGGACDQGMNGKILTVVWFAAPENSDQRILLEVFDPTTRAVIGRSRWETAAWLTERSESRIEHWIVSGGLVLICVVILWPDLRRFIGK